MNVITQYGNVVNGEKQSKCLKCNSYFSKEEQVVLCDRNHIFHKYCWKGECTTGECQAHKEGKDRMYMEENQPFYATVGLVALLAIFFGSAVIYDKYYPHK